LSFDGADDYVLGSGSPFDFEDSAFTVCAWFKTIDSQFVIVSEGGYSGGWSLGDGGAAGLGKIKVLLKRSSGGDAYYALTPNTYNDDKWHHVVAVITTNTSGSQGNVADMYMDGSFVSVQEGKFSSYDSSVDDWRIAARARPTNPVYFNGAIDDVRIYDRPLSGGEVSLLFDSGFSEEGEPERLSPLFAGAGGADYHLLSERGRYWPLHDVWVLDDLTSPCIDGGDPAVEPWGERMPNGGAINMGAFGGTAWASMSEWPIGSDRNYTGNVDFEDWALFCAEWLVTLPWADGQTEPPPSWP